METGMQDSNQQLGEQFPVTQWTVVIEAARKTEDTNQRAALERLCAIYWGPLYNYVRRKGQKPHDAEDLTQGFFAHLLEKHGLGKADEGKGLFRSFLLKSINNFMINEWRKITTIKRGSGSGLIAFDALKAEERYLREPQDNETPEVVYRRECARAILERALAGLRDRYEAEGKLSLYNQMLTTLMQESSAMPYQKMAEQLNTTENALRSETYRMRKELKKLLRQIVAPMVGSPAEVDLEIKEMLQALSRRT